MIDLNLKTYGLGGCGESTQYYEKDIRTVLNKYPTIGLNLFPCVYPDVKYWCYVDYGIYSKVVEPNYKGQKIVTSKLISNSEMRKEKDLITYIFNRSDEIETSLNGRLYMSKTAQTIAHIGLNVAIIDSLLDKNTISDKKINIIMMGIDLPLDGNWNHFYCEPNKRPAKKSQERILGMREGLYKYVKEGFVNLYTLDPYSTLDKEYVKYINIKDLI